MPTRILREGFIDSENVNRLSPLAERAFVRLILKADDFGRYHANPQLLRSNLFPLRDDVTKEDAAGWLAEWETAHLVHTYTVNGTRYLEIRKFNQRTRAQRSKFPDPPADGQLTDKCQASASHPRSETETEAKTDSEANAETIKASKLKASSVEGGTGGNLGIGPAPTDNGNEKAIMERFCAVLGADVMANDGGKWRNRVRTERGKVERVLAAIESDQREGRKASNGWGAYAEDIWKRFA